MLLYPSQLITAIRNDIATARATLTEPEFATFSKLGPFTESLRRMASEEETPAAATEEEEAEEFSFMAPPEGFECDSEEECVIPGMEEE